MKFLRILFPVCFMLVVFRPAARELLAMPYMAAPGPVKIGLLITERASVAAKNGAELAIHHANANGGFQGRPFELVVRSMEGPWGTGSKEAVNLIFEHEVYAIMGSHDGRNAHLVEQVSAKAHVIFMSAWASDPTLSQAFVPWYFSCVPNDLQQANTLIEDIYTHGKYNSIVALTEKGYDTGLASDSFLKKANTSHKKEPLQLLFENSDKGYTEVIEKLQLARTDCIVLFGKPASATKLLQLLRQHKMNLPVYGTLSLLDEEMPFSGLKNYEGIILSSPGYWSMPKGRAFCATYQRTYGNMPVAASAYAYDGMNVLIEAITKAGLVRDQIQKTMLNIRHDGVTGIIQFDSKGNRAGTFGLMTIKNGIPVALKRD
jgi:branched-chain amino acid transport system substrate-binding protein